MDDVKSAASPHVVALLGETLELIRTKFRQENWSDLRPSHFRLLSALPAPGLSITELADRLGMTKQGCGQFVTVLAESGHVTVTPDPADRRVRIVRRTVRGDETVHDFENRVARMEQSWADRVGARRYATFRRVMEELASSTE